MERHRIEVILEATQPIKHLSESFGNTALLATRKVRQSDGTFAKVPEVSGDAMRHGIREAAAYAMLHAIGATETQKLSEAALRLLFAGGMVTGKGDAGSVRLGEYRKLVDMVPQLAFLGGCAENRTIPGRLEVDPATLICAEHARYVPAWMLTHPEVATMAAVTCRESIEEPQRVRMDPSLNPAKRALLDPSEADKIERRLDASERASRDGDAVAKEAAKSTMMPRRYERLAQGSLFSWTVTVTLFDALDADAFYTAFCIFAGNMIVGGGRATGHGAMRVVAARREVMASFSEVPRTSEVGLALDGEAGGLSVNGARVGSVYFDHVRERAPKIIEYLRGVNA